MDEREKQAAKDLETALKYWVADKEAISVLQVERVELIFDPGWSGTDVTPGDPPEVVIQYTIKPQDKSVRFDAKSEPLTKFIGEIAATARRVVR